MAENYDLVIVGGGTGGYAAAIRASQMGKKTALVERDLLGGTCLHRGCIPSKALLRSAEVFRTAKEATMFGVKTGDVELDFSIVQERKQEVVDRLANGVRALMKKGKIDVYHGTGRMLGPSIFHPAPGTISVDLADGENVMLIGSNVMLATGSSPRPLPHTPFNEKTILSSDHALTLEELPESMLIVGGGVIGIEWASMLTDFGVNVTVVEYGERILPTADEDISKEMMTQLKKRGVVFLTNAELDEESIETTEDRLKVNVKQQDQVQSLEADKMLVSIGRVANAANIGIENTDIILENGYISVNEYGQTKESHIYAIGDCIGGLQLAHVATHEGLIAVAHMNNEKPEPIDPLSVASCIYSFPESAQVGMTEKQAKDAGIKVKTSKFPFAAVGKALVQGEEAGFVKMIVNETNDDVVGIHIIGSHATDLISEAALAKTLDAAHFEIGETIHPHPTMSEAIGEAALAINKRAIHM
ncbi:LOW QUALITY PROTEIN: dihydrolipoamide dehydrogenase of branched-chain alpha-keto acid dehydrogenase [Bacillus sp. JCM 19046]|nr:LOW QUALITY PROTEIN: dihydrolipoamide dehydrogenase of branched-chain alpha-keto acid dehydrogenase [Bacillus sp. JCM 19045]GAF16562.1 LOW QUALITY PROTEIN: dihydrolipoamide dehydrogenase of branched-chain alpha-keto acid dehydrogenase [Bacillus sp. JCM 19046]